MTANTAHIGEERRTILESEGARPNYSEHQWMSADGSPAVFKTVCGRP